MTIYIMIDVFTIKGSMCWANLLVPLHLFRQVFTKYREKHGAIVHNFPLIVTSTQPGVQYMSSLLSCVVAPLVVIVLVSISSSGYFEYRTEILTIPRSVP